METLQVFFVICFSIAFVTCNHGETDDHEDGQSHYQRGYHLHSDPHRDHHSDPHRDHHRDHHRYDHHSDSHHEHHRDHHHDHHRDHHRGHYPVPHRFDHFESRNDMRFGRHRSMHHQYDGYGSHGDHEMHEPMVPRDEPRPEHHRRRNSGCCKNSKCGHNRQEEEKENEGPDNKIWRFQIGDNFGGFEYLDNSGRAKGFHIDLMKEVCEKAGKKCHFVVDAYNNCWNTLGGREFPGVGLMDNYYDGCIGLMPTPERQNSLNFTLPFAPNIQCGLLYNPGTEQTPHEARNVTGKKIGFVSGWALSRRCFQRQEGYIGNSPDEYIPTMFESHKGMMRALIQNEIDAALTVDSFNSDTSKISLVEPTFSCTLGGSSVMTRYGSEVLDWWNDAFQRMKHDDTFRQLCRRANEEHGHKGRIRCLFV